MRSRTVLVATLLLGCGGASAGGSTPAAGFPEPSGNDEVMRDDTPAQHGTLLSVGLDADPELQVGHDDELSLHVRVRNEGDTPVAADALVGQLRVDEGRAVELDLTGHGWITLQPGESAEWDTGNLGVRLFDAPGEHTLQLEIDGALSEPVRVRVSE